jgi:nucleotide sugar dehydrogenase
MDVVGIDTDSEKLVKINNKISPIQDERVSVELKTTNLHTSNTFDVIKDRDIIILCVPTPVKKDKSPDYSYIVSACENISHYLAKDQLVIIESTINPGTTEEIIIPLLENGSNLIAGTDFYIAHVPERINPGDKKWHVGNIARVVGGLNSASLGKTKELYESIIDAAVYPLESIKEAEAVKIVENCYRDINIAFVNELAMSFSHLGINLPNVIRGASTKPFEFLPHYPGCGVGGHCIPVDPYYLIDYAKRHGFKHDLLMSARNINNNMPKFTVGELLESLEENGLNKNEVKVCLLGLTYKANIQDIRESPANEILKLLKEESIAVTIHDPFITHDPLDKALNGAKAVIIATAHDEYTKLSPDYFIDKGIQVIIDGRNCLDYKSYKNSSLTYRGIGC